MTFNISTNNWYKHSVHEYTKDEVDIWILCDMRNIYLLRYDETDCKKAIALRKVKPINNQSKKIRYANDYIISEKRVKEVFI